MPIIRQYRYSRTHDLQANPHVLYVFGDNMAQVGYGGQAKEARDEPNAIGIPTLWLPGVTFENDDFERSQRKSAKKLVNRKTVHQRIDQVFALLYEFLVSNNGIVVWPTDNVGTGFADLPRSAPLIMKYINDELDVLKKEDEECRESTDKEMVKWIEDNVTNMKV